MAAYANGQKSSDGQYTWDASAAGGQGAWQSAKYPNVYYADNGSGTALHDDTATHGRLNKDGTTFATTPTADSASGNLLTKAANAVQHPFDTLRSATDAAGLTHPDPPDLSKGPDAEAMRGLAGQIREQYTNFKPGEASTIAPERLDTTQSDQARQTLGGNISDLQGVASGATPTAANAMFQRGTDTARANAAGLAAAYSRGNPGLALRAGLTAGNQAQAQATAVAAEQKANEQAQARGQIGQLAGAMRGQDLTAAGANQNATMEAQKSNQTAGLQQQGINNQKQLGLGNLAASSTLAPYNAAVANQQLQLQNQANNQQMWGSGITAAAASDERVKTDIKPVSLADALAKQVHGVSFTYKPGHEDGGHHVGVLAQDLEKAMPGAVSQDANGVKNVDTRHVTLGLAGATAELAKRLRAVEGKKDGDEDVKWGPYPYAREAPKKPAPPYRRQAP